MRNLRNVTWWLGGAALVFLLTWLAPADLTSRGLAGYAPLHTFLEMFSMVIAMLIFGVTWNAYLDHRPGSTLFLACTFLVVALIDFAHTMSFPGMPDFVTPASLEKAINFWLAARFIAAAGLLAITIGNWVPIPSVAMRRIFLATSLAMAGVVFWLGLYHADLLPRTFEAGRGLTPFKIGAEYLIVGMLLVAAWRYLQLARRTGTVLAHCLLAATVLSALSELCFTLYSDAGDLFNLLGHVYKIIAYAFIYQAVFVYNVRSPFERLSAARLELRQVNDDLTRINADLTGAQAALRESEGFVRSTMDALLANICVLDESGNILAVNRSWREFASANGQPPDSVSENANYLEVCDRAIGTDSEHAADIARGIRSVLAGAANRYSMQYPCHSPQQKRWFMATASRFQAGHAPRVVVAHLDITQRVLAEEELARHATDLRAANDDLVHFNRSMVDRELRMIELKKEINALCGRFGESPRYPLEFEAEEP